MHELTMNGVMIVRTPTGIGVGFDTPKFFQHRRPVTVQVEYNGRRLKEEMIEPNELAWRDYFGSLVDHLKCVIRVKDGDRILAELGLPPDEVPLPYMVRQGEQRHITESYISVPPALTITDERGDIWTLGFDRGPAPEGEFAFNVLKDGCSTGAFASRIERRNGRIRVFTRDGWKGWTGREFV